MSLALHITIKESGQFFFQKNHIGKLKRICMTCWIYQLGFANDNKIKMTFVPKHKNKVSY